MILVEEVARMVESKTEKAQQSFDYDEVIQKMRADLGLPAQ